MPIHRGRRNTAGTGTDAEFELGPRGYSPTPTRMFLTMLEWVRNIHQTRKKPLLHPFLIFRDSETRGSDSLAEG
jgi:hypothetical protein